MSVRTGNRSRHNRRIKKYAKNRERIREFRATLTAAAAAAPASAPVATAAKAEKS
jgi:hypothetical protein